MPTRDHYAYKRPLISFLRWTKKEFQQLWETQLPLQDISLQQPYGERTFADGSLPVVATMNSADSAILARKFSP